MIRFVCFVYFQRLCCHITACIGNGWATKAIFVVVVWRLGRMALVTRQNLGRGQIGEAKKQKSTKISLIPSISSIFFSAGQVTTVARVLEKKRQLAMITVKQVCFSSQNPKLGLSCNKSSFDSSSCFRYIIFSSQPLQNNGQASSYFRLVVILS